MGCGELHHLAGIWSLPTLIDHRHGDVRGDSVAGETGTCKELLGRLIHAASGRTSGMYSVNCAALNDAALFSSSALKDASDAASRGVEAAETRLDELCATSRATLFLDQVSELSPASQGRVLRAILRTGDYEPAISARALAWSRQPTSPWVRWSPSGRFKRELYDRLAVLTLRVPPLRERRADIGLLAAGFLSLQAPRLSFMPAALRALSSYPFPGNVRELHNVVTRLAIMRREGAGRLSMRPTCEASSSASPPDPRRAVASIWKSSPFDMRREMAMQALMVCRGDRAAAAASSASAFARSSGTWHPGRPAPASRGR